MFSIWFLVVIFIYIYRYFKIYRKRWSNWNIIIWVWALVVYTCVAACINLDEFIYFSEARVYTIFMQSITFVAFSVYPWIHYHTLGDMTVPFWRHNYRNIWSYSTLRFVFLKNSYSLDLFNSWVKYQNRRMGLVLNYLPYMCIVVVILFNGLFQSNNIFMEFFFFYINRHLNLGLSVLFLITITRSLFSNNFILNNLYIIRTSWKYPGKMDVLFHFWSVLPWHDWKFVFKIDNEFPLFAPEAKHGFKTSRSWMFFERLDWVNENWRYNIPASWICYKFTVLDQISQTWWNKVSKIIPKYLIVVSHHIHYFFNEIDDAEIDEIEQFCPEFVYSNFLINVF
jgi:hypothetical protein